MDIPNIDRNIKIVRLSSGNVLARFTKAGEDLPIVSFYLKVLKSGIVIRGDHVIEAVVFDMDTNQELLDGKVFTIYLNNINVWEYCEYVPKVNVDLSSLDEDSLIPEDLYK